MDFEKILELIIKEFEKNNIHYGLIGGFAMGALGIMRATVDLDFLVRQTDMPKIEKIMNKYEYNCIYKTKNVSQYVSDIEFFGEIDFLHAFREISVSMLKRAKKISVLKNRIKIKVLNPEDIIGLKVQAMANDLKRRIRERADIEDIMKHFGKKLNWRLLKKYFHLFEMNKEYEDLKEKYG